MCLSIPGKVIEISDNFAKVNIGGSIINAALYLTENVEVGDYVLVHAGYILEKLNKAEAIKTIQMIENMNNNL